MGKHDISDKQKIFRDQIGQKATVERAEMSGDAAAGPNRMLKDLGEKLQGISYHLKTYRYLGSAAVHIYYNDTLEQLDFISQTGPLVDQGCPEDVASKSIDDLVGTMKELYGKKRSRLRSGF